MILKLQTSQEEHSWRKLPRKTLDPINQLPDTADME